MPSTKHPSRHPRIPLRHPKPTSYTCMAVRACDVCMAGCCCFDRAGRRSPWIHRWIEPPHTGPTPLRSYAAWPVGRFGASFWVTASAAPPNHVHHRLAPHCCASNRAKPRLNRPCGWLNRARQTETAPAGKGAKMGLGSLLRGLSRRPGQLQGSARGPALVSPNFQ